MCGIAGKLNLDGRPVEPDLLRRMAGRLVHRGPDDEGLHVDGAVGLAAGGCPSSTSTRAGSR